MAYNFFEDWLEDDPEVLYRGLVPQNVTRPFLNYFNSQFGNVYGDYLGGLGRTALSGQEPTQSFGNYLEQFPFMKRWQDLTSQERGETPGRFAPRLRWSL